MIAELSNYIKDKRILILGFGKEGVSSYQRIRKLFPEKRICIADINAENKPAQEIEKNDRKTKVVLGENYLSEIENYDLVLKSPGIYLSESNAKISSQTDLFLRFFHKQTIGITGTKGKSTTSSLIHHILTEYKKEALLVGNIGKPVFDYIDQIKENTIIVFELSSHQLTDISVAPSTAIFLNLYPEHLDHYPDFESYGQAKGTIFRKLNSKGTQIYFKDQKVLGKYLNPLIPKKQILTFSAKQESACYLKNGRIYLNHKNKAEEVIRSAEIKNLLGQHNCLNIMAAILACTLNALSIEEIKNGILSFKNLEHRLEYVGKFANIYFYNDSIATIPEACIMALKALPETDTLLLGGFDRGLNYLDLYHHIEKTKVRNLIFMGPCGKRMLDEIKTTKHSIYVESVREAFEHIPTITAKEKVCLLSPAAASYDKFQNFEQRGELYKKIAGNLSLPAGE